MPKAGSHRRERFKHLCDLAKSYRGITHDELAERLGRHPARLIPENGNPKLDYLMALARVLDWPVSLVVSFAWGNGPPDDLEGADLKSQEFEALQDASREAQVEGRYETAVKLARRAFAVARTPDERVIACIREASGYDGLGHFAEALKAEQRGLLEHPASGEIRRQLESNLANGYYTLWALPEAQGLSLKLVDWYRHNPPTTYKDRVTETFSLYVYGSTLRRMVAADPDSSRDLARSAKKALEDSRQRYLRLGEEFEQDWCRGIANTITGALLEVEVALGERDARDALEQIDEGLRAVIDPSDGLVGDWLESYAWWSIFGCNIANQSLSDEVAVQRYMAEFTDKADDIARRLNNWALRERVFAMEYASYERAERLTGRKPVLTFDQEDLQALVGVMARFPSFCETGMRLYDAHIATTRVAG